MNQHSDFTHHTNHLGTQLDKQFDAGHKLPESLTNELKRLQQATKEFKSILHDGLPKEVLNNCWVVKLEDSHMTVSVNSATAANHIRYMSNVYLELLCNQSITFKNLKTLKVIVANTASFN